MTANAKPMSLRSRYLRSATWIRRQATYLVSWFDLSGEVLVLLKDVTVFPENAVIYRASCLSFSA